MDQVQTLQAWRDHELVDAEGNKIGKISDFYLDEDTGRPEWLAVSTGMFGTKVSFVPLTGATPQGDRLVSRWTKDQVKDAPNADPNGGLSHEDEARLYQHYGLAYGEPQSPSRPRDGSQAQSRAGTTGATDRDIGAREGQGHDTSGPNTDSAMTRSEEELRVGTRREEAGRVRLRKWVETEQASETVPVQREEVHVEREPITAANRDAATSDVEISEETHEVALFEERAVAEKVTVPKERVRLEKDVVTGEERVSGDVRKEHVEVEGDGDRRVDRDR
jgi:uncharacterized protein (TIGR02271 family)